MRIHKVLNILLIIVLAIVSVAFYDNYEKWNTFKAKIVWKVQKSQKERNINVKLCGINCVRYSALTTGGTTELAEKQIFVSYSRNFEDIILSQLFLGKNHGFYIDVGASHPVNLSVTKALYDRGWHGINIEPLPDVYACLEDDRKRDVNLRVCAGDHDGTLQISEKEQIATADPKIVKVWHPSPETYTVKMTTLERICERYCQKNQEIDFCKVSADGFVKQILRGFNFENYRPKVFLIKSTKSEKDSENEDVWESILTDNGYEFLYQCGLTRYYVDQSQKDLKQQFRQLEDILEDYAVIILCPTLEEQFP